MSYKDLSEIFEYEECKASSWPKNVMGVENGFTYRKIKMVVILYFPHSNRMGFLKKTLQSGLGITRIIQNAH